MSVHDNEQLGAEPAIEACGSRPIGLHDGSPAEAGASGPARCTVPGERM
ncbi:hypothetical protein [Nonomuraea diastatica]|nr:hypothetical protein [Nonomuraea diastatica]